MEQSLTPLSEPVVEPSSVPRLSVRCRVPGCGVELWSQPERPQGFQAQENYQAHVEGCTRAHYAKRHLQVWIAFKHWLGEAGAKAKMEAAALHEANSNKLYQDLRRSL